MLMEHPQPPQILKCWFTRHEDTATGPYPTTEQKRELAEQTGLTAHQVGFFGGFAFRSCLRLDRLSSAHVACCRCSGVCPTGPQLVHQLQEASLERHAEPGEAAPAYAAFTLRERQALWNCASTAAATTRDGLPRPDDAAAGEPGPPPGVDAS